MLQTGVYIMARKPYARTFRYSEETRKILEQYDCDFDEFVHYAFFKAREAEEETFKLDIECQQLKEKRDKLYNEVTNLIHLHSCIYDLERTFKSIISKYET